MCEFYTVQYHIVNTDSAQGDMADLNLGSPRQQSCALTAKFFTVNLQKMQYEDAEAQ